MTSRTLARQFISGIVPGLILLAAIFAFVLGFGVTKVRADGDPSLGDAAITAGSTTQLPVLDALWDWQVTVTNYGTASISNLHVRIDIPCARYFTNQSYFNAVADNTPGVFSATIPKLEVNGASVITFKVMPWADYHYGFTTNSFYLTGNESDSNPDNNTFVLKRFLGPSETRNSVVGFDLPVTSLVYDPSRSVIYGLERNPADTNGAALEVVSSETFKSRVVDRWAAPASRLQISSDYRFLYGLSGGGKFLNRRDLNGLESKLITSVTNLVPGALWIDDFVVDPGDSRTVVAVLRTPDLDEWVVACRDGVPQGSPRLIPGHLPNGLEWGIWRVGRAVRPGDFTVVCLDSRWLVSQYHVVHLANASLESVAVFGRPPLHKDLGAGMDDLVEAFSIDGTQPFSITGFDRLPETGRVFGSPYLPTDRLLADVPGQNRFVTISASPQAGNYYTLLQVVDRFSRATMAELGAYLDGIPDSMALLNQGRVAVSMADGTWTLFGAPGSLGSPLEMPPDLAILATAVPAAPRVGERITVTLTVTNRGEAAATFHAICQLPPGLTNISVDYSFPFATRWIDRPDKFEWPPTLLEPGKSITFQIKGQFAVAGPASFRAGVGASAGVGLHPEDNVQSLTVPVLYSLAPGEAALFGYNTRGALFDPKRKRILAIAGFAHPYEGQILEVDPSTGLVVDHVNVGPNPITLGLSSDARILYALTAGGRVLTKIDRESMQVLGNYPVGPAQTADALPTATALMIDPGNADLVVLRRSDGFNELYVEGLRTGAAVGRWGGGFFSPGRFAVIDGSYAIYSVSASGPKLEVGGSQYDAEVNSNFLSSHRAPWYLNDRGLFIYPELNALFNPHYFLADLQYQLGVAVDWENRLTYSLEYGGRLKVRDLDTQSLITTLASQIDISNYFRQDFLAGQDYVVGLGDDDTIGYPGRPGFPGSMMILRTPVPISGMAAGLSIGVVPVEPQIPGELFHWLVSVTNSGPAVAPNARVDLRLPDRMLLAQAVDDPQASQIDEPTVSFSLGDLVPGQVLQFPLTAILVSDGPAGTLVASVRSTAPNPLIQAAVARSEEALAFSQSQNRLAQIPIQAADATYVAASRTLMLARTEALAGTNAITELDPSTGAVIRETILPGVPGALASSPEGNWLYVALDDAHSFARLKLPGLELCDIVATKFTNAPSGSVLSIVPLPGQPPRVVISGVSGVDRTPLGTWMYDGVVRRDQSLPAGANGIGFVQLGVATNTLMGFLERDGSPQLIKIGEHGLSREPIPYAVSGYSSLEFYTRGKILLSSVGKFDLNTHEYLETPPADGLNAALALSDDGTIAVGSSPNQASGLIISGEARPADSQGFRIRPSIYFMGGKGPIKRLLHWGKDGIAAVMQDSISWGTSASRTPPRRIGIPTAFPTSGKQITDSIFRTPRFQIGTRTVMESLI